jgi:phage terminase large subunit
MRSGSAPARASWSENPATEDDEELLRQFMTAEERAEYDLLLTAPPEDYEGELARCAADVVYWVNNYVKTYDPRLLPDDPTIPFNLFPRQEEYLHWLEDREAERNSGVAEKSRDVGFTCLCCAFAAHRWRFRKGFSAGFGSRKKELVDSIGNMDSIFEKIRFILRHLPIWMMPAGFDWRRDDNHCKINNPDNGSSLTGEGGDQIGRGGRKTMYFIDEAAFLLRPKKIDAALSSTTKVKIWVSTPNGPGNSFYEKRFSGKIAVFTFHWHDDPRKDDAWYQQQKDELDEVTLAQEVDLDYTASVEGICIPAKWVQAAVDYDIPATGPTVAGLDLAGGGKNKSVLAFRRGPVVTGVSAWSKESTASILHAGALCQQAQVVELCYDWSGIGMAVYGTLENSPVDWCFVATGVNGGSATSNAVWPSGKASKEIFANRRAELWWKLRERFRKTYENVTGIGSHPPDECISIPNHRQLIAELSMPLQKRRSDGKILIESKEAMKKRGVASPDHADALAYTEDAGQGDWSDTAGSDKQATPQDYVSEAATVKW